jgi:ABC-type nitrate/sulfonate/bicarbonate transport system permease component
MNAIPTLLGPLGATLAFTLVGFLAGAPAGLAIGLVAAEFPHVGRWVGRPAGVLGSPLGRAAAAVAMGWAPGPAGLAVLLAAWLGCFPVARAVLGGQRRLPRAWLEALRGFGASAPETMALLRLPAAAPVLCGMLGRTYAAALAGVVAAQCLGGPAGAGTWLRARVAAADFAGAVTGAVLLAAAGATLAAALHWLPRRLGRWTV